MARTRGLIRHRPVESDSEDDERRREDTRRRRAQRADRAAAAAVAAAALPACADQPAGASSQPATALRPAAAAAASSPTATGDGALDAAIRAAHLPLRRAVHSHKLRRALAEEDYETRVESIGAQLQADVTRPESLIDWSRTFDGDESCLLFELLDSLWDCLPDPNDRDRDGPREMAVELLDGGALPFHPHLLRTFDPATVNTTGNNALHVVFRLLSMADPLEWTHKLVELLIARGVSVHARNQRGRTPLLVAAAASHAQSAAGCQLLLAHGADLNAQDDDGDGVLHHLARRGALDVLEDVMGGEGASHIDLFMVNRAGRTAADTAAIRLAEQPDSATTRQLHHLLLSQQSLWTQHVRPLVRQCVEAALVPDLATLVLAYVDGSGPPFTAAEAASAMEENSDDDDGDDEEKEEEEEEEEEEEGEDDDHSSASSSAAAAAAASS